MDFTCNVCGGRNTGIEQFGREVPSCPGCLSSVRIRALVYALSEEIFGAPLLLRDFPVLKSLRGIGMTDSDSYAAALEQKFDYRNTYFDREPKLDITGIEPRDEGTLDFLISSEVFEHVKPPLEAALENACRMLRPNGVLILTVPYAPGVESQEHFPKLADYAVAQLHGGPVLVNRTAEGDLQVFENLLYHGGHGSTLEMRRLNEAELRRSLLAAGFSDLRFYGEDYAPFGICHSETWSLPVAARKQPLVFDERIRSDLARQFVELRRVKEEAECNVERLEAEVKGAAQEISRLQSENLESQQTLRERTLWARGLEEELKAERARIPALEDEVAARTAWALDLERQLDEKTKWAVSLDSDVRSRTEWAQDLQRQFDERTEWAMQLDSRVKQLEGELAAQRSAWWARLGRLLRIAR